MAEKNKIVWERWKNPSVISIADFKKMSGMLSGDILRDSEGNLKLLDYSKNHEESQEAQEEEEQKVVFANGTMIPFDPKTDMSSAYNIWIGHANFDLTAKAIEKIGRFPGVEVLKIISRYRFVIGFGRAFLKIEDEDKSKQNERKSNTTDNEETRWYKKHNYAEFDPTIEIRRKISELVETFDNSEVLQETRNIPVRSEKQHKFWIEYTLPNERKVVLVSDEDNDEFKMNMEIYKEMFSLVGGSLKTYLDP